MVVKVESISDEKIDYIIKFLETNINLELESEEMKEDLMLILEDYKEAKEFDFRMISNYIHDGIYITDGNCVTLFVNDAYERITGLKAHELVGKTVSQILEAGLYENAVSLDVARSKKAVSSIASSERGSKTILITGKPILDENGNIKKIVMLNRDITELNNLKSHLEETEKKLEIMQEMTESKAQEIQLLRRQSIRKEEIIAESYQMKEIIEHVKNIAPLDITVLITGETGVGKEVIADTIYKNSKRADQPFIKVNCGAIPENLLESELFGYEEGAFSGASVNGKAGMFELANGGTILLDEIGDMPLDLQVKLLRVIENKVLYRVGGTKPIKLDVRIMASTNRNLKEKIEKGQFREDLFYRLNVFNVHVPPLRERPEDVVKLIDYFSKKFNRKYNENIYFDDSAMEQFKKYRWPGNIRELKNIVERVVVASIASGHKHEIDNEDLDLILRIDSEDNANFDYERSLKEIVDEVERKTIKKALNKYGSTRKAAKALNVSQSTIVRKSNKLGIK